MWVCTYICARICVFRHIKKYMWKYICVVPDSGHHVQLNLSCSHTCKDQNKMWREIFLKNTRNGICVCGCVCMCVCVVCVCVFVCVCEREIDRERKKERATVCEKMQVCACMCTFTCARERKRVLHVCIYINIKQECAWTSAPLRNSNRNSCEIEAFSTKNSNPLRV